MIHHVVIDVIRQPIVDVLNPVAWRAATMPTISFASTAPGSLLEVQEWTSANVTKKRIDKVSK